MTSPTRIFLMGDSKTDGDAWVSDLFVALRITRGLDYEQSPASYYAGGGWRAINELAPYVVANLPSAVGNADLFFINIGTNELSSMPLEADWKTAMLSILDTIHAKFPSAYVYLTKPWRRNYGTEANTLAGWIDDVIALRPTFAFVGDDERDWFENGDNGTTYSDDGVHYNVAGQTAKVVALLAVLGY